LNNVAVFLKYQNGNPVLRKLRLISIPSKRVYVSYDTIIKKLVRSGVFVISTSTQGLVLTENYLQHDSKFLNVGGELLFQVI
jgi:ribosomal protein S8